VARGIATPPLVVARAEGALVEDADGRTYIDFAGGLGCQNTGHGLPAAVEAIREQLDRYLHQCFMVGMYQGLTIAPGGATERYELQPDLVTLAKTLGGGLPNGAVGGTEEVMEVVQSGCVNQVGTFNGSTSPPSRSSRRT
jgi:glutamate-1-semialdehyde aminotransferase